MKIKHIIIAYKKTVEYLEMDNRICWGIAEELRSVLHYEQMRLKGKIKDRYTKYDNAPSVVAERERCEKNLQSLLIKISLNGRKIRFLKYKINVLKNIEN